MDPFGKAYGTLHAYTAPKLEFLYLATTEQTIGVVVETFNMLSLCGPLAERLWTLAGL
jgi:hypothetical protein